MADVLNKPEARAAKDPTARQKLLRARSAMVLEHPFFASLALRLDLREDRNCATAWTDGQVFGYNPNYVKILSHDKLVGLAAHTVMHPACRHHLRRGQRNARTWNLACDYVINPILVEAGLTLPDGFLMDPTYTGKSAEAVYDLLHEGEAEDQEAAEGDNATVDPNGQDPQSEEEGAGDGLKASDQDPEPPSESDPGMAGEVRDGDEPPRTAPGDAGENRTDWEQALVQAAANARSMGKLPRGLDLFVKQQVSPRLPWEQILARFIQRSARQDYTWTLPNRRYIHQNLYFPALISDGVAEIAVAIDTSGSIQPAELAAFGAELSAILAMNPARVHLIYSDMAVNQYQVVEPWDLPIAFAPKGGGGTDFRAVFDFLGQMRIQPFCLVFLSDMECRWFPAHAPAFPVIWVRVGQGGVKPPFGREIHLIV